MNDSSKKVIYIGSSNVEMPEVTEGWKTEMQQKLLHVCILPYGAMSTAPLPINAQRGQACFTQHPY